jgi:putative acetyltransferase
VAIRDVQTKDAGMYITPALSAEQLDRVRTLFREYAASVNMAQCFEDFESELGDLPGEYQQARGSLLLATVSGTIAGCCALRPLDRVDYANACEMKRLFVRPQFRGLGLGRMLAEAILDQARQCGFECVLLDTLDEMEAARSLYDELGFEEIPPYCFNPIAGAHYLKAEL